MRRSNTVNTDIPGLAWRRITNLAEVNKGASHNCVPNGNEHG